MKHVLLSKHPEGELFFLPIQASVLKEENNKSLISINSNENYPLVISNIDGEIIYFPNSDLASISNYDVLYSYEKKVIKFNRVNHSPLIGTLKRVSMVGYIIETEIPSTSLLPYDWPPIPEQFSNFYHIDDKNLGLPSFWRLLRRCTHKESNKPFIFKVIPKIFFDNVTGMKAQVLLEKEALSLKHNVDHLCTGQTYEDANYIFVIQEYATLGDCEAFVSSALSLTAKKYILKEMFLAVKELHDHGYIHNRLSLSRFRLFSSNDGITVKLSDFGYLTKKNDSHHIDWLNAAVSAYSTSFSSHILSETISPERKSNAMCVESDLYALGKLAISFLGCEEKNIRAMCDSDPTKRPDIATVVQTVFSITDKEKSAVQMELKTCLSEKFFLNQYQKFFLFDYGVSEKDKRSHI